MVRALLIIDVQNDFTEGGALGVEGGAAVAASVTEYLRAHPGRYSVVYASRDWHDADGDNGGHFATAEPPDFRVTWPAHCVAGTTGADYHPGLDTALVDVHVRKGQGAPAYSLFQGTTDDGASVASSLGQRSVTDIDVVGIATDYCVRASAIDAVAALGAGPHVRVLTDLVAGVDPVSSAAALEELMDAGVDVVASGDLRAD